MSFTHFNEDGKAKMVDVSDKKVTERVAVATGSVKMSNEALVGVIHGQMKKGDVLAVAQVAGIMGAKKTSDLIPMCHNLFISGADIRFNIDFEDNRIHIEATVKTSGQTGIEMEALTAVSTAALTIYDMCKAVDKTMVIEDIKLVKKTGGKSGVYIRKED
jgi:cyclic pyranopterin phosphate synthase